MADEPLIWTDVHFDHQVAQHAAGECERAARLLRDTVVRRGDLARDSLAGGAGPWRDELIHQLGAGERQAIDLERRLRGLARALLEASARASVDQAGREAARRQAELTQARSDSTSVRR